MKLSKNNIFARFNRRTFCTPESKMQKNFCPFFWKTILAVLILPLTLPSFIYEKVTGWRATDFIERFLLFLFAAVIIGIIVGLIISPMEVMFMGGIVLTFTAGVALIIGICYFFSDTKPGKDLREIIGGKVESVKEGYCPRIEWED